MSCPSPPAPTKPITTEARIATFQRYTVYDTSSFEANGNEPIQQRHRTWAARAQQSTCGSAVFAFQNFGHRPCPQHAAVGQPQRQHPGCRAQPKYAHKHQRPHQLGNAAQHGEHTTRQRVLRSPFACSAAGPVRQWHGQHKSQQQVPSWQWPRSPAWLARGSSPNSALVSGGTKPAKKPPITCRLFASSKDDS